MIFSENFDEIYSSMIAGGVPSADGSPASLMLVVQDILGTDDLHLVSVFDERWKRIYYFAAPSRAFHSTGKINLPLIAAIPGQPGHRGNGAYFCSSGGMAAAAVFNEGELRLFANGIDAVQEAIFETGLPVYDVGDQQGILFESVRGRVRRQGEYFLRRALTMYGFVALACGIGYVGLSAAAGYIQRANTDDLDQRARSLEKLSTSINFVSPLHERLARLQAIATVVVRSGGWIEEYEYDKAGEGFRLMLPEWVTGDHYAQLGVEVTADAQGDGMVAVQKVKKGGKPVASEPAATSAPAAASGGDGSKGADAAKLAPNPLQDPGAAKRQPAADAGKIAPAPRPVAGAPITPPSEGKDPQAPQQAPFGSPASRPPKPAGAPG